ncbi:Uu.00g083170.m01.CDS01 [Anthostomella pinea]|uniref:Uu.00g083170.m01.CDS01 n=1 Tax=Anthostomella pinea TaxID=933095 RepID=A0AAI8VLH3_9PEZI|nr:Uu.00g083170.m01.CDS01 [Anthostomella pinea]
MALNTSRSAASFSRQALRHCRSRPAGHLSRPIASTCSFATSATRSSEQAAEIPRWMQTPERMKAPFSPHITKDPARSRWKVNEDAQKLDDALNNFLGRDGERMLPDELKWLGVTHKSFDQGRRGFNDRLAFLGRQICAMEATQSIITSPADYAQPENDPYADRRQPYEDPALRSLDNLTNNQPNDLFTLDKLTKIALDTGLTEVVRWKPRMPENIKGSGFNVIMSGAIYALVGAVALQNGGKVASRVVRERIMKKIRPKTVAH